MVVVSLLSNVALASCPNATYLRVGDKVTDCDRVGLSLEYDKQIRAELIEADFNKKIIEEQKKVLDLKDMTIQYTASQSQLWKTEAERSRELYDKERQGNSKNTFYGILMGIGLTVAAGWAIGQAAR